MFISIKDYLIKVSTIWYAYISGDYIEIVFDNGMKQRFDYDTEEEVAEAFNRIKVQLYEVYRISTGNPISMKSEDALAILNKRFQHL